MIGKKLPESPGKEAMVIAVMIIASVIIGRIIISPVMAAIIIMIIIPAVQSALVLKLLTNALFFLSGFIPVVRLISLLVSSAVPLIY